MRDVQAIQRRRNSHSHCCCHFKTKVRIVNLDGAASVTVDVRGTDVRGTLLR
ncbi:MAG: hypothetical protein OCU22_10020 [Canidatus Methanoxibalbensis ujae]|nr:hypothetical protein [Candidatus Methanoxibalbensis ujae]